MLCSLCKKTTLFDAAPSQSPFPSPTQYSLHENMGKVIKQIVDELTSSPPQLLPLQK